MMCVSSSGLNREVAFYTFGHYPLYNVKENWSPIHAKEQLHYSGDLDSYMHLH